MLGYLLSILAALKEIIALLKELQQLHPGDLNPHLTTIIGRNTAMSIITKPTVTLSDIERVLISLAPKLPDGSPDPGPFTWTSSDTSLGQIVGLDANGDPDPANTAPTGTQGWLLTPAGAGSVSVTIESASPNVNGNLIPFVLTEGRTGDVNASVGTPVPDNNS